jgi:hypothetical protein
MTLPLVDRKAVSRHCLRIDRTRSGTTITRSAKARPSTDWPASTASKVSSLSASTARPALMAQNEMPQSRGIRRSRLVRSRGQPTSDRRVAARLLHTRWQAHLCGPGRHGDAGRRA